MTKVNLGIIGLGYIGKTHMKNALRLSNVNLVAVADASKRALSEPKKMGIKTFTDYDQLLKQSDVDAVVIALPTHLHLDCSVKSAEAGKHIFLEKPMARNVEESKQILTSSRKNSVTLMMGYPLRFNDRFRDLKTKLKNRVFGDVEIAYGTYISAGPFFHRSESHSPVPVPKWWFNKELTGGGALVDVGSHMINLLRWCFGEITSIRCNLGHRFNLDFEDSAVCLAKFDSGTKAVITVGWFMQGYQLSVDCFGTVGKTSVEHVPGNRFVAASQMLTTGISDFHRQHLNELQYFVDCLQNDKAPSSTGEDGVKDMEVISQAYKNSIFLD